MERLALWMILTLQLFIASPRAHGYGRLAQTSRLRSDLLYGSNYWRGAAPIASNDEPLTINTGVSLVDVVNADTASNQVDLVLWLDLTWVDVRLQWDPTEYSDVSSLALPADTLWLPDLVFYSQTRPADTVYPGINARVSNDGAVHYVPSANYRVHCDLAGLNSKAGAQCSLKFGSWSRSGSEIDLKFQNEEDRRMDVSSFFSGSKYEVIANAAKKVTELYPCCPEPYVSLQYNITIRAKGQGGRHSFFGLF